MQKKLTITVEEEIYLGLKEVVGAGKISKFIENLVRPYVIKDPLEQRYRQMAEDRKREEEASEWERISIEDLSDASR
jgi:hypothetical protein